MRAISVMLVLLSTALLAGCPKTNTTTPDSSAGSASGAATSGLQGSSAGAGQQLTAEQQALKEVQQAGSVIFFDYDKAEIKPEYVSVIAAHAKYLNGNAGRKARLEGHTDERGSREYNIGLGERRAQAVRRALMLQGVPEAQLVTVSYGEERPAVDGHDEAAYAKNRRVEIAYGQ
jgi:peptidoglycan-associated lipoprotein